MSLLHPRVARELAAARILELEPQALGGLSEDIQLELPGRTFAPVGGREVTVDEIRSLRDGVLAVAQDCGFPEPPGIRQRVSFDGRVGRLLHERMGISPHDAADEEIWSHLTLGPLVDVAVWRFPARREEQLLGRGPRSVFRRLWWRAELLGPYSWDEEHPLQEDETVQIMERPELVGNPAFARALARGFLRRVEVESGVQRMNLMRDALKRAYRLSPFLRWEALTAHQLGELIDRLFTEATAALLDGQTPAKLAPMDEVDDGTTGVYLSPPIERAASPDAMDGAGPAAEGSQAVAMPGVSTFDEVPLAHIGQLLRTAVDATQEVDEDALAACFEETHHIDVPRRRRRVLLKLAHSARGRGLLEYDENTGVWSPGPTAEAELPFGEWSFAGLVRRADELLPADPEPFEQMLHEVAGDGRAPRIVASVVGTSINEAKKGRRGSQ
jgi:hypothetical protein